MRIGSAVGAVLGQGAWPARPPARLEALVADATTAIRRAQGRIQTCFRFASSLEWPRPTRESPGNLSVLTCDLLVTYHGWVTDDDRVFKALADPTRRFLLDRLFERDGRTLGELEADLEMTRFGVMKHLRVLEEAGVVVSRRAGREKLHFLNPVPIRLIHDRWIDKYAERHVSALADLKATLEEASA
jgi:DNA-binding transcriptional ArsR family regulator